MTGRDGARGHAAFLRLGRARQGRRGSIVSFQGVAAISHPKARYAGPAVIRYARRAAPLCVQPAARVVAVSPWLDKGGDASSPSGRRRNPFVGGPLCVARENLSLAKRSQPGSGAHREGSKRLPCVGLLHSQRMEQQAWKVLRANPRVKVTGISA